MEPAAGFPGPVLPFPLNIDGTIVSKWDQLHRPSSGDGRIVGIVHLYPPTSHLPSRHDIDPQARIAHSPRAPTILPRFNAIFNDPIRRSHDAAHQFTRCEDVEEVQHDGAILISLQQR